jgi:uncharacterized membrane protein YbhN (UPF0104 family)
MNRAVQRLPANAAAGAPGAKRKTSSWRRAWPLIRKAAPWLLAAVVAVLLVRQARSIDWQDAWRALQEQPPASLAIAAALGLISYALVASYDLIGRHVTGHPLSMARTLRIAAICYSFNLNFGSLVGALAVKLRLYTRAGLDVGTAGRVIVLSIVTNWVGYLFLGGVVLAGAPPVVPPQWPLSTLALRILGIAMIALAATYLGLAWVRGRRSLTLRGRELPLPGGRVALWQAAVAMANWALMGVIVWVLLQQRVDYPTVLGVLLLAAVAGVITHIPAGLGVIEAVFVVSLGEQVSHGALLAALLAYRAVYYLLPLTLGTIGYACTEAANRRNGSP